MRFFLILPLLTFMILTTSCSMFSKPPFKPEQIQGVWLLYKVNNNVIPQPYANGGEMMKFWDKCYANFQGNSDQPSQLFFSYTPEFDGEILRLKSESWNEDYISMEVYLDGRELIMVKTMKKSVIAKAGTKFYYKHLTDAEAEDMLRYWHLKDMQVPEHWVPPVKVQAAPKKSRD